MLREVLMVEAWIVKFQREAKTLSGRFMPYSVLKICGMKPLFYRDNMKYFAAMNKKPVPLK